MNISLKQESEPYKLDSTHHIGLKTLGRIQESAHFGPCNKRCTQKSSKRYKWSVPNYFDDVHEAMEMHAMSNHGYRPVSRQSPLFPTTPAHLNHTQKRISKELIGLPFPIRCPDGQDARYIARGHPQQKPNVEYYEVSGYESALDHAPELLKHLHPVRGDYSWYIPKCWGSSYTGDPDQAPNKQALSILRSQNLRHQLARPEENKVSHIKPSTLFEQLEVTDMRDHGYRPISPRDPGYPINPENRTFIEYHGPESLAPIKLLLAGHVYPVRGEYNWYIPMKWVPKGEMHELAACSQNSLSTESVLPTSQTSFPSGIPHPNLKKISYGKRISYEEPISYEDKIKDVGCEKKDPYSEKISYEKRISYEEPISYEKTSYEDKIKDSPPEHLPSKLVETESSEQPFRLYGSQRKVVLSSLLGFSDASEFMNHRIVKGQDQRPHTVHGLKRKGVKEMAAPEKLSVKDKIKLLQEAEHGG